MKIIAESGSTRTEWVLIDNDTVVEHAFTEGINPFFQTRREISHSIRLELPSVFFKKRWEHVYFYGAGCTNADKRKILEASMVAQFKSPVSVYSDLLGAARGLLLDSPGLACILGAGSNSCYYDGTEIAKNVKSLGFILGDEGSGAVMGKLFLSDCLKEIAPLELCNDFYKKFKTTADDILDTVYTNSLPNRSLATYSYFLADYLDNKYVYDLVYNNLMNFFKRNVAQYDYNSLPLCFVGSTAHTYADVLRNVASDFGVKIMKIERTAMPGLVMYHSTH